MEVLDAAHHGLFHVDDRGEDHRRRDLRHDDHGPHAAELQAAAAGGGLLQPIAHASRYLQCRHDAGNGGGRCRQQDCNREGLRRQIQIEPEVQASHVGFEKAQAPVAKREVGNDNADDSGETTENERFGEHLRDDAAAARAERRADDQVGFT